MDSSYFWTGWQPVLHTLLIGVVGDLVLVLLLRGTGPRTMAKMTPLDFVVAVTLGSTFGRTVTAVDVGLAQAVAALVLLVGVQWALAGVRARWNVVRRVLDSPPALLYFNDELQHRAGGGPATGRLPGGSSPAPPWAMAPASCLRRNASGASPAETKKAFPVR